MWWRTRRAGGIVEQKASTASLLPLTSSFDERQHAGYVHHLEEALKNPRMRNIALTGNFGIGKSSILDAVRDAHPKRVLNLSLSTLGEPPSEPPADPSRGSEATSLTNRIQKEIVKQLLYREIPSRVPNSRYRRLGRFRLWREALITALPVAAVAALLALLDLLPPVIGSDSENLVFRLLAYGGVFALATGVLTWVRRLINPRWSISQVSAAGTSVSLSTSVTYFDKYLDEIVYFFEVTRADVVIFEDIDRFEDSHIFEALRELNTLLNGTKQLKRRSIRFVYAIKDSIFEEIGRNIAAEDGADAADVELARANRTKFFDLVIPVVPFITHRSARDLMTTTFAKVTSGTISTNLIDLAAKHVADMRLIKNIRNEFVVFSGRLLDTNTGAPGLKADALLAMLIYKNIHLSDFERISRGDSRLDKLYHLSRQVVSDTIARLEYRDREIGTAIDTNEAETEHAKLLGTRLQAYLDRVARHTSANFGAHTFQVGGQQFNADKLVTPEFWETLTAADSSLSCIIGHRGQTQGQLKCSLEDLRAALDDDLDPQAWVTRDRQQLLADRQEIRKQIEFVRHADMADLTTSPEFTGSVGGKERSFDALAEETLGSRLAVELLRAGYIDRNFTLYVSQYYGVRVSADVMNFIVHNVQPGVTDMHYTFPGAVDIDALLEEAGQGFLTEPSAYNIQLVDHLAARRDDRLRPIITNLVRLQDGERAFLSAYLQGGDHTEDFATQLAGMWRDVYRYLVEEADVSEIKRSALVAAALIGASDDVDYEFSDKFSQFVQSNAARMRCLTDSDATGATPQVVRVLRRQAVHLESLSILTPDVRRLVVAHDLYVFSRTNLRAALDQGGSLSLDRVREIDQNVYLYSLEHLGRYNDIVSSDPDTLYSIDNSEAFGSILTDLDGHKSGEAIGEVISQAAPECRIERLSDAPRTTWPYLANDRRIPVTFDNIWAYFDDTNAVDANLASLLTSAAAIVDVDEAPEGNKHALAVALINAREVLPDVHIRIALAGSLDMAEYIDPSLIATEPGALLSLLLEHNLVEDTSSAFERFRNAGWPTLERAIGKSDKFATFLSPALIDEGTLPALLTSPSVSEQAKRQILAALPEYTPTDQVNALSAAGNYANGASILIEPAQLQRMASAGVKSGVLIPLLARAEASITDPDLSSILATMPEPYRHLAGPSTEKLIVPCTDAHEQLLRRLKRQGIVQGFRKRRMNPTQLSVTMADRVSEQMGGQ